MMTKRSWQFMIVTPWSVAAVLFMTALVAQEAPTVNDYFDAYLDAREETIDGVRTRLNLLERGAAAATTLNRTSDDTQSRVNAAYATYGFTPPSHLDYGTRFTAEIDSWLQANPDIEQLLQDQDEALKALSDQIRAFSQNN